MSGEDRATRLKRLRMRSMRRGIKEMDLILGRFAETHLETLDPADLDVYEALLDEYDQDLYAWVTGNGQPPDKISELLEVIARQAGARG